MARPKLPGLSDNELAIMKILWQDSPLAVSDILGRLRRKVKPAYTTVLSAIQVMERKGYLKHIPVGKAHSYYPVLQKSEYERTEMKSAAKRISDGGPLQLAINIVKNEHLSATEIAELKKVLDDL